MNFWDKINNNYQVLKQYPAAEGVESYEIKHNESELRKFVLYIINTSSAGDLFRKFKIFLEISTNLDPNIICINKKYYNEDQICLITEHASGGSLFDEIQEKRTHNNAFTDSEMIKLSRQLISACLHLQRLGIAHFNIRLKSIVKTDKKTYKLTNFFFACRPGDVSDQNLPDILNEIFSFNGLEENLYSPEVLKSLNGQACTVNIYRSDVYLLGLVLLSAASLDTLSSLRKIQIELKYAKIKEMIENLNYQNRLKFLLRDMLEENNARRPDFESLYMKYFDHCPKRKYPYDDFQINPNMKVKIVDNNDNTMQEKRIVKSYKKERIQAFTKELYFYKFLEQSPYVLQIFYSDEASRTIHLEYYEYSLQDFINENKYFNVLFEDISKKFIHRLVSLFANVESERLVHGCIKPGHIMVNSKLVPKIIDFSTMILYEPEQEYEITADESFKATELIGKRSSNGVDLFKAEVFSLGLVIFQLFAGYPIEDLNKPSRRNMLDQCLASFEIPVIKNLLVEMLNPDPRIRPNFSTIMSRSRRR